MESVLLHFREDGKPLDVGATGQTNVELPGGEGFRVDGAAIEGKTLGLMDGDGVSKLEGDLRELADSKQTSNPTLSRPSAFWRRVGGRKTFPFFPVWAIAAARILSRPLLP